MKYYEVKAIETAKLTTNTTGMDYTEKSMRNHFDEIQLKAKVVEVVERLLDAGRKHILIFASFVADAEYMANLLQRAEINATFVSGETPKKEREDILEKFRNGTIKCVANV